MQHPHNNLHRLIFSTFAYFDIFDFPLRKEEILQFVHSSQKVRKEEIENELIKFPNKKVQHTTYYFLPERESIVEKRHTREKISDNKLKKMMPLIKCIGLLPTITLIGISGSLAMKNGDVDSDIDVFVIALPHTVWLTRFLMWIVLLFTFKGRQRNRNGKDSLCVNLLMDRDHLLFPRKDIYTAHEIVQILPVVNKYQTHELFLSKNIWALKYLANSFEVGETLQLPYLLQLFTFFCIPVEKFLMWLQLFYMRGHKTIEQTTDSFIAFHPYNYRDTIIKEFEKRDKHYAI